MITHIPGIVVVLFLFSLIFNPSPAPAQEEHRHDKVRGAERVGNVHFPISSTADAQERFDRAVALLHSFWYEKAEEAFSEVVSLDPRCAMAYWGKAMTLYHPLWEPPETQVLARGREYIAQAKAIGAKTEREQAFLDAAEAFFKDSESVDHPTRARAYEAAMRQVYEAYPDDNDAAAFYALALLGTAPPTDKTYSHQKAAAEILNGIARRLPDHPGVVHYLIHAYDSPPLAQYALDAARSYAQIAPAVPHALHMPSHIFTQLGLWDESIASNTSASRAARQKGDSEQETHARLYLAYAYLQCAQDEAARTMIDEAARGTSFNPVQPRSPYPLAMMEALYALELRDLAQAASLPLHPSRTPQAEAVPYFARALGAARTGNAEAARVNIAALEALRDTLAARKNSYWSTQVEIQHREATAWLAFQEGRQDEARQLMKSAAALEDSTSKSPATPGPLIPAHEMFGDLLIELGDPREALSEYEASLAVSPNRFHSLAGAARAATLAEDTKKAAMYYSRLLAVCEEADTQRPELMEAKEFLATN